MTQELRKAFSKNQAPIWKKLAKLALKPTSARKVVNLTRINKFTKENDIVIVPGKLLGTGNLSHKISLCSFSISNAAAKKIIDSGGKIMSFSDIIKSNPTGKGVTIIG